MFTEEHYGNNHQEWINAYCRQSVEILSFQHRKAYKVSSDYVKNINWNLTKSPLQGRKLDFSDPSGSLPMQDILWFCDPTQLWECLVAFSQKWLHFSHFIISLKGFLGVALWWSCPLSGFGCSSFRLSLSGRCFLRKYLDKSVQLAPQRWDAVCIKGSF